MSAVVKICGLSNETGVRAVSQAGAEYAGFVYFERSPRHVTPMRAAVLKKGLSPQIKTVSVLVDPDDGVMREIKSIFAPDFLQLHGSESPQRVAEIKKIFSIKVIKAVKVSSAADIAAASAFYDVADMLMFDATPPKDALLPGGNGAAFDWSLLAGKTFPLPWFLSGGLDARNVRSAIRQSGATMVDVSSGVESSPGVKDPERIAQFVKAAKL